MSTTGPDTSSGPGGRESGADLVELTELAVLAARLGARTAADAQADVQRRSDSRSTKSSHTDLVTEADRATEVVVRDALLGARPQDGFLGEESVAERDDDVAEHDDPDRVVWVVDPIDGTTNYVYGQPDWAVSVAATRGGRSLVGVVLAPRLDLEYVANLGGGATRNGRPLTLKDPPPLDQALVATGFGYDPDRRGRQGSVAAALLPRVRDIRRRGAAALDFCYVADGSADAYYETGPRWWDFAAGSLIATEAGANFAVQPIASVLADDAQVTPEGGATSGWFLLVAAPPLFDSLLGELTRLDAPAG